jgi:ribosome biogenesis GTPase A
MESNEKNQPAADGLKGIEIKPDLQNLRAFRQTKMALADQLRIIKEAVRSLGMEETERQLEELMGKLAEDHFTLAVLGQFKRGKSSLMNAIVGRELLPTGLLPLTSAITALQYGPTERLLITRENSMFTDELPVSTLPDYVTEKGNPANQKKVKKASVELPVPFLRQGLEFVDTPGVGSVITANTAVTYGFLPECDAVILVTSVDTPMSSLEMEFLKEIRGFVDKIFFVVNKTDLVSDDELSEVMGFVTQTIKSQVGRESVKIYPVSARLGLAARMSGDAALYQKSGLKAFEEALAVFLSEEKSTAFLISVVQKALRIVADEAAQGAFGEAALQRRAAVMQRDDFVMLRRDPHEATDAVMGARSKLEALRDEISAGQMERPAENQEPPHDETKSEPAAKIPVVAPVLKTEDLGVRGCPVCRHIAKGLSDFYSHWQYAIGSEESSQAEFAAELGFCPLHTWQLLAMCSPQGASIGFTRLTEQIARQIGIDAVKSLSGNAVRQLVRSSRNCRVCGFIQDSEKEYVNKLAGLLEGSDFRNQYRHSQGVCLRHLGMLLDAVKEEDIRTFLLSHTAQCFEEDAEDMRSFALKHESRRRALENRNEEDAYRRAIIRIVGERSLCVPWAEDGEI